MTLHFSCVFLSPDEAQRLLFLRSRLERRATYPSSFFPVFFQGARVPFPSGKAPIDALLLLLVFFSPPRSPGLAFEFDLLLPPPLRMREELACFSSFKYLIDAVERHPDEAADLFFLLIFVPPIPGQHEQTGSGRRVLILEAIRRSVDPFFLSPERLSRW